MRPSEARIYVPPFDDPLVIAGQGTIGLELAEEVPDAAAVLVPIGGGGLIAGVAAGAAGVGQHRPGRRRRGRGRGADARRPPRRRPGRTALGRHDGRRDRSALRLAAHLRAHQGASSTRS